MDERTIRPHRKARWVAAATALAVAGALVVTPTTAGATAPPVLSVDYRSLDFGHSNQPVGSNGIGQRITVTNQGPGTATNVQVGASTSDQFVSFGSNCGSTLDAGATCRFFIRYAPTRAEQGEGRVTVTADGGTSATTTMTATPDITPIYLRIRRAARDFGPVPVGTTSPIQNVHITNRSDFQLTFTVTGQDPTGPFSSPAGASGDNCGANPIVLNGGATCTISYRFAPVAPGPATGSATLTVALQGFPTRTYPVELSGYGGSIGAFPLVVTPHGTDWAFVAIPDDIDPPPAAEPMSVTNVSALPRTVHLTTQPVPGFAFTEACDGVTLAPGASCGLTYVADVATMSPRYNAGVGHLDLRVDGFPVRRVDVPLTAWWEGDAPVPWLTAGDVDLGPAAVGSATADRTVTLYNLSRGQTMTDIAIAKQAPAADDATVSMTTTCGASLAAGQGCDITVRFAPTSNDQRVVVPFRVTSSGPAIDLVVRGGPRASVHTAFIAHAVHAFLHREPTSSELAVADQLDAGTRSRADVVTDLASSPEWTTVVVQQLYVDTLGRPGDPSGVAYWAKQLTGHRRTVAQVAAAFYASDEYFSGIGGGTADSWVRDLYVKLLARAGDPAGIDYWVRQASSRGRSSVAMRMFQSPESRRARVTSLYRSLLGRPPDAPGRDYWAGRIATEGDLALAVQLAASEEFLRLSQSEDLPPA